MQSNGERTGGKCELSGGGKAPAQPLHPGQLAKRCEKELGLGAAATAAAVVVGAIGVCVTILGQGGGNGGADAGVRRLDLGSTADGAFDPWAIALQGEPIVITDSWVTRSWATQRKRETGNSDFWSLPAVSSRCHKKTKILSHVFTQRENSTFVMFRGGAGDATVGKSLQIIGGTHGVMRLEGEYDSVIVKEGLNLDDIVSLSFLVPSITCVDW